MALEIFVAVFAVAVLGLGVYAVYSFILLKKQDNDRS